MSWRDIPTIIGTKQRLLQQAERTLDGFLSGRAGLALADRTTEQIAAMSDAAMTRLRQRIDALNADIRALEAERNG